MCTFPSQSRLYDSAWCLENEGKKSIIFFSSLVGERRFANKAVDSDSDVSDCSRANCLINYWQWHNRQLLTQSAAATLTCSVFIAEDSPLLFRTTYLTLALKDNKGLKWITMLIGVTFCSCCFLKITAAFEISVISDSRLLVQPVSFILTWSRWHLNNHIH